MRIRKLIFPPMATIIAIIGLICFNACGTKGDENSDSDKNSSSEPLNITIFLDLSDRLTRDLTPSQIARDTAIIRYIGDYFKDDCVKNNGLLQSKNSFQILFYPTPNSSEINAHAGKLRVDLSKLDAKDKRKKLIAFNDNLNATTGAIYQEVMKSKDWTGCDIWRFFSDKKVDQQCIKKGYRNILIILTDGYLFYTNDKIKEGHAYSYILPQTIKDPESSLIVKRKGLDNLEVLMLEVNPYETQDIDKMKEVLETWFREMGVSKFVVAETDIPENTKIIINNFLNQE